MRGTRLSKHNLKMPSKKETKAPRNEIKYVERRIPANVTILIISSGAEPGADRLIGLGRNLPTRQLAFGESPRVIAQPSICQDNTQLRMVAGWFKKTAEQGHLV